MYINKNAQYYLLVAVICVLLKGYYNLTDKGMLLFLLYNTNSLVDLISNTNSVYIGNGFYNEQLAIIIDMSCSGFNFMLLCFITLSIASFPYFKKKLPKVLVIIAMLLLAYVLTVFVNASRIISSVYVLKIIPQSKNIIWLHEAQGAFIYLSFLILFYLGIILILNKLFGHYAKPA